MTDRPTPEQIAHTVDATPGVDEPAELFMYELKQRGYLIVHPDDVPTAQYASAQFQQGWYACRVCIFGETL